MTRARPSRVVVLVLVAAAAAAMVVVATAEATATAATETAEMRRRRPRRPTRKPTRPPTRGQTVMAGTWEASCATNPPSLAPFFMVEQGSCVSGCPVPYPNVQTGDCTVNCATGQVVACVNGKPTNTPIFPLNTCLSFPYIFTGKRFNATVTCQPQPVAGLVLVTQYGHNDCGGMGLDSYYELGQCQEIGVKVTASKDGKYSMGVYNNMAACVAGTPAPWMYYFADASPNTCVAGNIPGLSWRITPQVWS